jgi:hypothetical protein
MAVITALTPTGMVMGITTTVGATTLTTHRRSIAVIHRAVLVQESQVEALTVPLDLAALVQVVAGMVVLRAADSVVPRAEAEPLVRQ